MASGYIAGGALAGIVIALVELVPRLSTLKTHVEEWQTAHNPFLAGAWSDLLSLLPFAVLIVLLYLVGRDVCSPGNAREPNWRDARRGVP